MSLNHLTSRKDPVWDDLNIGCSSFATQNYYFRDSVGVDFPIITSLPYQITGTGLIISFPNSAPPVGPEVVIDNTSFINNFVTLGKVMLYNIHFTATSNGAGFTPNQFTITVTLPSAMLPNTFTTTKQATGVVTAITAGSARIVTALESVPTTRNIIYVFPSLPVGNYSFDISGSTVIV